VRFSQIIGKTTRCLLASILAAGIVGVMVPQASVPAFASPDVQQFPAQGWSLGGKVRSGPGMNFRQSGSLGEFNRITVLRATGVIMGEYEWFEISYSGGRRGFQWGGILCLDYPYQGAYYCERRGVYTSNPIGGEVGGQVATVPPQTAPPIPMPPTPPSGQQRVGIVYYNGGSFERNDNLGPNMWQQQTANGTFTFQETQNVGGQIYLWDGSRQLWMLLDLPNQRIMSSPNQGSWTQLHGISRVFYPDGETGG
jgi:hypothetical protein